MFSRLVVKQLSYNWCSNSHPFQPHECPKCGRRYADRKSLRIHMFTHDAVKPFICHICSQGRSVSVSVEI